MPSIFCDHKWETKHKEAPPSAYEQMGSHAESWQKLPAWVFEKKIIIILECTKCGKLDKTIETVNKT